MPLSTNINLDFYDIPILKKITLYYIAIKKNTNEKLFNYCGYKNKLSWYYTQRSAYFKLNIVAIMVATYAQILLLLRFKCKKSEKSEIIIFFFNNL